jgi:hypothetical protein
VNPIKKVDPQLFQEFDSKTKEKIAAVIDTRKDQLILSQAVEDYVYGTTRSLDVGDYHGVLDKRGLWEHAVNKNSDYFDITEMEETHPIKQIPRYLTFRTAGMYKNHESDKIENAIGLVFDAVLIKKPYDDMHVTTLFGIDKQKAPRIARDLELYPKRVPVSMGCHITHSICTACGKEIIKQADICSCLMHNKGRRIKGKIASEFLKGTDFFELSVVGSPAAVKAYVIDAISKLIPGRLLKVAAETSNYSQLEIMSNIYTMIRSAKTHQDVIRLNKLLDEAIYKLESLV